MHKFQSNPLVSEYPAGPDASLFKGILLLQQLEDNDEKRLFPKFQFIPIFRLQVMHDYVHWYCSIDYCVK